MKGLTQKVKRESKFYPSTPTLEQAIEKLDFAQDLLIDVALLMNSNWNGALSKSLVDVAGELGGIIVDVKRKRSNDRWAK